MAAGGDAEEEARPPKQARTSDAELSPLQLMAARNKGMHSEESVAVGRALTPRPTDVFVTTYPKCGTTWVTQICHLLRGGTMDFGEITEVCPWDILAFDCGQDLNADQVGHPRVFKSHERSGDIAKGGRYIHVCREPRDAFISFHRFLPAWAAIPDGAITAQQFAEAVFGGVSHSGGIWDFFAEWWERRAEPEVLWVCYEDLKEDLEGQVRLIADFMGVQLTEALLSVVLDRSSFDYMRARQEQFDEHFVFEKVRGKMGIPPDYVFGSVSVSKVRAGGGTTGEGKLLPPEVLAMLDRRWETSVLPRTGLRTYEDMRRAVRALQAERRERRAAP